MSVIASQITSLAIVYSTVYWRRWSKKTSKLHVTGLCEGNSQVTGDFPTQRVSNMKNVSIWWCHHGASCKPYIACRKHCSSLFPQYFPTNFYHKSLVQKIISNRYCITALVLLSLRHVSGSIWVTVAFYDVMKWNYFPRYWSFVRGIHQWPVNSPHKSQWSGALMLSLSCTWTNGWVNNRDAGDLRCHHTHYDFTVMSSSMHLEWW